MLLSPAGRRFLWRPMELSTGSVVTPAGATEPRQQRGRRRSTKINRGKCRVTLRARLLLLVVLAVIPAVCIEIYGEIELRSSRQREIHEEAMRLVRLAASEQARIGEGAKQLMIAFSEAPSVRHGDWASCNGTAVRIRDQVEGYSNIGIADLDGHILCAAVPPPPGYHARVSALASKDMASNDVVAGTYLVGKIVPGPHMAYAISRRDDSGEVVGVIWAIIDLDWLAKHFADRFTSPNLTLLITDREGTILVRLPDQEAWVGKPVGDPYRFMLDAPDYGAADMAGVDGVERIIAELAAQSRSRRTLCRRRLGEGTVFRADRRRHAAEGAVDFAELRIGAGRRLARRRHLYQAADQ